MSARDFIAGLVVASLGCWAASGLGSGAPPFEQHFAPAENLERIDVALIDGATRTLDVAAYVLTDRPVIEAIARAARRGVRVRLFRQLQDYEYDGAVAEALAALEPSGVEVRYKDPTKPLMHLKAYCIDSQTLRVGAANFSHSGLRLQDNDLELARGDGVCTKFVARFEKMWRGE